MSNLSVGDGLEERDRDPTAFRDFEAKGFAAALRHGAGDQERPDHDEPSSADVRELPLG
ncbi:hypothetical protein HAP48_0027570 [Bradyrhizobium septentrionale]|uniref:Uncharacterized protein n=1 Tax=Bradyrhizobium septentrionale TaxID=1404411 RepID=A0A973VX40_9BRAD|nr:hypothetical protein [Bradyrhizobium septentrionale]UGY12400.1 hypothetical protein HAP48_0027570 [Bradyrhizobium septentrionale]UGY25448.1 hypothetical protein HU675_0000365 [Bradyrhizobium septentrionale]